MKLKRFVDICIFCAGIFLLSIVINACGSKAEPDKQTPPLPNQDQTLANMGVTPSRGFEPGGIRIIYSSADNLNYYESVPHTVTFIVYQMEGTSKFNDLAKSEDGLLQLLQAERFDASVVGVDQYFIEPGEQKTLVIDRAEKAKWVGVVSGYYNMSSGKVNRVYEIPVSVEKKGVYGFRTTEAKMEKLVVKLHFGSDFMQEVQPKEN
jgi:type VI secretion system VasD/TssJ family lipoprotein